MHDETLCKLFYFFFLGSCNLFLYLKTIVATTVETPRPSGNPCINNPCGPFSQCRAIGDTPACSCLPNYIGRAPNCRPECIHSAECPSNLACINERCGDPCVGACGIHTFCTVINHNSICQCDHGFTGDPFSGCTEIPKCKIYFSILYLFFIHPFMLILSPISSNKKCFSHFLKCIISLSNHSNNISFYHFARLNTKIYKKKNVRIEFFSAANTTRKIESMFTVTMRSKCHL